MLHAFLTYINSQSLFEPTDKVLLAVSGGKDSVLLFDLFLEAKFNFAVAHCNFRLRGEDSDKDALFVQQLCEQKSVPFYTVAFDTRAFAKANKLSIEMAARQMRYEWFEQIRLQTGSQYIATAHHLNDSIETILLNLTKGTGIAGLRGIQAKKQYLIRPLLFASRADIEQYISGKDLKWREDSSNGSNDYQRNLLRNEVVPLLKQINPNLEQTFARNIERLQALEGIFLGSLDAFRKAVLSTQGDSILLNISAIQTQQSAAYLLEELLKEFGFNYFQSKEIYQALDKPSGKIFYSDTHTLVKDRVHLIITANITTDFEEVQIQKDASVIEYHGWQFRISKVTAEEWRAYLVSEKSPDVLWLDADKLAFPLSIRRWQDGDRFIPLGMKGQKKVSDFLVDKKVPLPQKKTTLVLTSGSLIVWLVGHRPDDRFKITPATQSFLKIEIGQ
ncbi:tRNA lysidine(34) synthetase TilS [Emticicia sp. 21SJ11W-3]|uniref:tRNA lysidine(34) synthetase TilS n=1 Tax=Emticicia sp. 21SJ11W-3 TaxID=2916755 RepID=UPI00209E5AFC|nr:tRNA lysidine(34) synthetase TilS [Emticicia sp. 21SJ11W-3]UTA68883.1 tRNA lysidine(34) synthetase TilS [Emticicia sp. 21SJ11W-3]